MKTVYIIEDVENLRDLLSTFFATTFPELEIVGMSGNGGEGAEQCLELKPDLVIVDIHLPEMNGLEILHLLKRKCPQTKILIYTGKISSQTIKIAIQGKADGLINKMSGIDGLNQAIEALQKDQQFFSPDIYDKVIRIHNTL